MAGSSPAIDEAGRHARRPPTSKVWAESTPFPVAKDQNRRDPRNNETGSNKPEW